MVRKVPAVAIINVLERGVCVCVCVLFWKELALGVAPRPAGGASMPSAEVPPGSSDPAQCVERSGHPAVNTYVHTQRSLIPTIQGLSTGWQRKPKPLSWTRGHVCSLFLLSCLSLSCSMEGPPWVVALLSPCLPFLCGFCRACSPAEWCGPLPRAPPQPQPWVGFPVPS